MITKTRSKKRTAAPKAARKARKVSVDKRATERTQLFVAATLYTEVKPDVAHKVWVTNISLGGLAFKTRREYEVGETFHIRLDAGPIDMDCPIRIVWAKKQDENTFEVGVEFIPD